MCAIGVHVNVLRDVACHTNLGGGAVIVDIHHVVGHWTLVDVHLVNLVEVEHLI